MFDEGPSLLPARVIDGSGNILNDNELIGLSRKNI